MSTYNLSKIIISLLLVVILITLFVYYRTKIMKTENGNIIILDGISTAGKTSILIHLMPLLGSTYKKIGVDDFVTDVFLEQKKLQLPEQEFLKRVRQCCNDMWTTVRKLVSEGKNVVVDTVLLWFEGEKDIKTTLEQLKDLNGSHVALVLVYCPLSVIAERVRSRNEKAISENRPDDIRSIIGNVKFDCTYRPRLSDDEKMLGIISRDDIKLAYQAPKESSAEEAHLFDQVKSKLLKYFGLNKKDSVNITSQLMYDCIVDSSKHKPQECAQQIYDCLRSSDMSAFTKNYEKIKACN